MTAVFEKILEMSATAAVVIVVVLLIRLLLRKAPKKYAYALWAVAAFRLVCPVSFKSVFSIFRFANVIEQMEIRQTIDHAILGLPQDIGVSQPPVMSQPPAMSPPVTVTVAPAVGTAPPPINMEALPGPQAAIDWASAAWEIAAVIWLIVLAGLLIYGVVSYVRLHRKMANAVLLEGNVYQSDCVRSPFILGFVRPKIYLPFGLSGEQQSYVLAHERYHLRRLDHLVRPIAFLILAVHWFNPLVWLAYYLMGRDMEMSCDEKVLGGADNIRKAYSITLLSFAANRRFPSPSPLAFGETGVKGRIKNALNWKKPRLWVTVVAVILCLAVLVACAANPKESNDHPHDWTGNLTAESVESAILTIGDLESGTDRSRTLSKEEVSELTALLRDIPKRKMTSLVSDEPVSYQPLRVLTVVCEGVEYDLLLALDAESVVLASAAQSEWEGGFLWSLEDLPLEEFLAELTIAGPLYDQTGTYRTTEQIYLTPLSSSLGDFGSTVVIEPDSVTYGGRVLEVTSGWEELTEERWNDLDFLFWDLLKERMGDYKNQRILMLPDEHCLMEMDGELWITKYATDPRGRSYIWSIYRLDREVEVGYEPSGYYRSVECVYMSPLSSWVSLDGNSGYYYRVEGDTLTLVHNGALPTLGDATGFAYPHDAKGGWEELTEERWEGLVSGTLFSETLSELTKDYKNPMIRSYEDDYFLLDLDGELLVGHGSSHPDGTGYIWDLYRLQPMTKEPQILKEWKAIFGADLNHDGNDEAIEVVYDTKAMNYHLTATETMGGNGLWEVEVSAGSDGNDCYYLYEKDGKTYLMRWSPNEVQSMYRYSYEVFWFDENGDKQVLAEHALQYDIFSTADILKVDLDELRAFEAEVNGLLADAAMIFADRGQQIGDPDNPATSVWRSPAEEWERVQREQAGIEVLAEWEADLTHDGQSEWIRVVATELDRYEVRVESENGSYTYWTGRAGRMHIEENGIYLYERDGKDYLMTWLPYSSTGLFSLDYCVFSLDNDGGQHVLVENGLMYDVMDSNMMRLDVAGIRAFEDEVNALLADAFVLVDTAGGDVLYSAQGNPISNPFSGYADDAEIWQAEFFGDSPQVHWFTAYEEEKGLVNAVTNYVMDQLKAAGITSGGAAVYLLEDIHTGTAGNTFSCNIYRVQYMLSEYDRQAGMAREQEVQQVYFMTYSGFNSTGNFWELMDVLTEEELQQYDTAAFETEYGGDDLWLYRAAVMETYRNWKTS